MVIADTSVWVDYIRRPQGPTARVIDRLLDDDMLATVGTVVAEVLQGSLTDLDFTRLRKMMTALPYFEATRATWVRAGRLSMDLRLSGKPTPLSDLVIAAIALDGDHEVFTLDNHFDRIPGLRLYSPETGDPDA